MNNIFSNSGSTITNTATMQGYYVMWNSGQTVPVTDEDSATISCVFADIVKTADKESVKPGDEIKYTITFKNLSDREMCNVKIVDDLSDSLTVNENGINPPPRPGESLESGISIGNIPPHSERSMTIWATVSENAFEDIVNRAYADFCFMGNNGQTETASTHITSVSTPVNSGKVSLEKQADKEYVTANGETVVFTITVRNNSSYTIEDVVVTDNLPSSLTYVDNSTVINGDAPINSNPSGGIYLGSMGIGDVYTVQFSATVNK